LQRLGDNINGGIDTVRRKIDLREIELEKIQNQLPELSKNGITNLKEVQALTSQIHLSIAP